MPRLTSSYFTETKNSSFSFFFYIPGFQQTLCDLDVCFVLLDVLKIHHGLLVL